MKLNRGWIAVSIAFVAAMALATIDDPPASAPIDAAGWRTASPREEIAPRFNYDAKGGPSGTGSWMITADARQGQQGHWRKAFPVEGGKHYRFHAVRMVRDVELPRRSAVARVVWQDDQGKPVAADHEAGEKLWNAEPEYPADRGVKEHGWTEVTGVYRAPSKATQAVVELHLHWAPGGRIEWSDMTFVPAAAPPPRAVRLASVHFRPSGGKSPMDNCRMFESLIEDAARQKADMVVLGETITGVNLGRKMHEVAEAVPGPSTDYFGTLAKKHNLYIVVGLVEREGPLIYNVAVLLSPEGKVAGKYRKVCLPRSEVEAGVAPGKDYPVFDTRFGKVGMMVCYDGFFPEVARELSNAGAEVIAWPVWGCNPLLASARACENHVYLVSSTYEPPSSNWALTAIYGHDGKPIVQADKWGTVVVAQVDLGRPFLGPYNLGDFKAEIFRQRPPHPAANPLPPSATAVPTKVRASAAANATPNRSDKNMKTVAILLYDGVELMDFTGPAEVFIVANRGKSFRVVTVAESTKPIKTMGGLTVTPDHAYADAPKADILIVPGGNSQAVSKEGRQWLKTASQDAQITMSVCFGAFLLADAGLLDDIEATTHTWGIAGLKTAAPKCKVVEGKRYIDSGRIITTAGVTAGIDGALHVVERILGKEAAQWTADEWMEHRWIKP